jgi:hypothetical protein
MRERGGDGGRRNGFRRRCPAEGTEPRRVDAAGGLVMGVPEPLYPDGSCTSPAVRGGLAKWHHPAPLSSAPPSRPWAPLSRGLSGLLLLFVTTGPGRRAHPASRPRQAGHGLGRSRRGAALASATTSPPSPAAGTRCRGTSWPPSTEGCERLHWRSRAPPAGGRAPRCRCPSSRRSQSQPPGTARGYCPPAPPREWLVSGN